MSSTSATLQEIASVDEFLNVAATETVSLFEHLEFEFSVEYDELAGGVTAAFTNEFLNEDAGVYSTQETSEYRQTSNVFPLAFDLVPKEYVEAVVENLAVDVTETRDFT